MEQRIYFDEGKLVVETNNGKIKDGESTTLIDGEFTASADTVAMLLAELEDQPLAMEYIPSFYWKTRPTQRWSLITKKEIAEEIKETKESFLELESKLNTATRKANMLKDVLDRIEKHNNKWWRFWERKIDISDIVKLYGTNLLKD